jgi:hypothetical protein
MADSGVFPEHAAAMKSGKRIFWSVQPPVRLPSHQSKSGQRLKDDLHRTEKRRDGKGAKKHREGEEVKKRKR